MHDVEPGWVGGVIRFWFDEVGEAHWFKRSDAVDSQIRDRFAMLHQKLIGDEDLSVAAPRAMLAAVVVLDQFSRNLFRNDARAFSADRIARRLSRTAVERKFDIVMKKQERYFLYLPFEHSEDRVDQALALDLIRSLGNEDWTRHAMEHKALIDRFGRFPHRNSALDRVSTADELESLQGRRPSPPT